MRCRIQFKLFVHGKIPISSLIRVNSPGNVVVKYICLHGFYYLGGYFGGILVEMGQLTLSFNMTEAGLPLGFVRI